MFREKTTTKPKPKPPTPKPRRRRREAATLQIDRRPRATPLENPSFRARGLRTRFARIRPNLGITPMTTRVRATARGAIAADTTRAGIAKRTRGLGKKNVSLKRRTFAKKEITASLTKKGKCAPGNNRDRYLSGVLLVLQVHRYLRDRPCLRERRLIRRRRRGGRRSRDCLRRLRLDLRRGPFQEAAPSPWARASLGRSREAAASRSPGRSREAAASRSPARGSSRDCNPGSGCNRG